MKLFKNKIRKETTHFLNQFPSWETEVLNTHKIQHLPFPVKKWLEVTGAIGREKAKTIWLKQNFQMKLKPEQKKWYSASAQQLFFTPKPSFIWTVRVKIMPLINVTGRDKFIDGKGEMQMKLNGIFNICKETGPKMDEGTLQRYLGEIVWFPSAAVSPYINWEAVDDFTAKATMKYKGSSGSGIFHFNRDGFFEKFVALRYKGNVPDAKRYEWVVTTHENSQNKGIIIPSKLNATWMLESGPWTWCTIEITDIRYNKKENSHNLI